MSLACAHAHPCADILLAIQAEHGSTAATPGALASYRAEGGDRS